MERSRVKPRDPRVGSSLTYSLTCPGDTGVAPLAPPPTQNITHNRKRETISDRHRTRPSILVRALMKETFLPPRVREHPKGGGLECHRRQTGGNWPRRRRLDPRDGRERQVDKIWYQRTGPLRALFTNPTGPPHVHTPTKGPRKKKKKPEKNFNPTKVEFLSLNFY